jgi:1,4-dihydroxy-2-naphthoate octaprenyltransferase
MNLSVAKIVRIIRAPFLTAIVIPVLLGTSMAWRDGAFNVGLFLLTFVGAVCTQIASNMSNDYFDHLKGTDEINRELTPFSGGSRVIQDGTFGARQVLMVSTICYLISAGIGVYLAWVRGWPILWLGLLGVFLAFFHNAPPVNLYSLAPGLGELAVGAGFGPVAVLGSYYVQTQQLNHQALWASIPIGLLIAAVLYINEFPDYEADRAVGKKTLIVVLGRRRAVWGYIVLLVAAYGMIVAGAALGILPAPALLALITLPLAYRGIRGALRFHSDTQKLIPTNATTIQIHLSTGLLLCVGYVVARFLGQG